MVSQHIQQPFQLFGFAYRSIWGASWNGPSTQPLTHVVRTLPGSQGLNVDEWWGLAIVQQRALRALGPKCQDRPQFMS